MRARGCCLTNVKAGEARENDGAQQHQRKHDANFQSLAGHLLSAGSESQAQQKQAGGNARALGFLHPTSWKRDRQAY